MSSLINSNVTPSSVESTKLLQAWLTRRSRRSRIDGGEMRRDQRRPCMSQGKPKTTYCSFRGFNVSIQTSPISEEGVDCSIEASRITLLPPPLPSEYFGGMYVQQKTKSSRIVMLVKSRSYRQCKEVLTSKILKRQSICELQYPCRDAQSRMIASPSRRA